jgi:hypothetical protein
MCYPFLLVALKHQGDVLSPSLGSRQPSEDATASRSALGSILIAARQLSTYTFLN